MSAYHHIRSMSLTQAQCIVNPDMRSPMAVISIVTPGDPHPTFEATPERWLVIEQPDGHVIAPRDATRIATFCRQHEDANSVLVVHCLMGVSRSPSIANGIAQHYGMSVFHMQKHVSPMERTVADVAAAFGGTACA